MRRGKADFLNTCCECQRISLRVPSIHIAPWVQWSFATEVICHYVDIVDVDSLRSMIPKVLSGNEDPPPKQVGTQKQSNNQTKKNLFWSNFDTCKICVVPLKSGCTINGGRMCSHSPWPLHRVFVEASARGVCWMVCGASMIIIVRTPRPKAGRLERNPKQKIWNSIYIPSKEMQRYTILLASTKDVLNVDVWICNFHISFTCNRSSGNYNSDFNHLRIWSLPGFIFPPKHEIWANYAPTWSKRWFSSTTLSLLHVMWIEPSSVRGCLPSLDC